MPRQRTRLVNGEIYHLVLRAVGDTIIFIDEKDFYRGIFSIYEFNNAKPVSIWLRRIQRKKEKLLRSPTSQYSQEQEEVPERDLLVEILTFSFMPNHVHLLARQLKDNGITQFMQKFGGGYANYFNKKYSRKGHLFNQFRAILIKTDEQLKSVFVYIHANPISLIEPGWKENGIKNSEKVIKFLEKYKWSSYLDYIGKKNFPSIINRDFLLEAMSGEDGCKEALINWIKYKKEMKNLDNIILE